MGYGPEAALSAVRFSFGWASTQDDLETLLDALPRVLARARAAA
jgi:cysteine sulfinate desulfinase/cysteine desulfurase-like protein